MNKLLIFSVCLNALLLALLGIIIGWLLLNPVAFSTFIERDEITQPAQQARQLIASSPIDIGAVAATNANKPSPSTHQSPTSKALDSTSVISLSQAQVMAQLTALANDNQWERLAPLLTQYLYRYPQDVAAQWLEGRTLIHTETSTAGITYLYSLLSNIDDPEYTTAIQAYIDNHVQPIIDALQDNQDWTALATFIEPLIQFRPQARTYIEPLALAYAMLNLPDAMENTLASLTSDTELLAQMRRLWASQFADAASIDDRKPREPNAAASSPLNQQADISIALTNRNGQWFSPVSIAAQSYEFLLDTGASTSAISGAAFALIPRNKRRFLGRILINTASGQAQARLFQVNDVSIGQWQLAQADILVLPVERLSGFDGLLGMNILNRAQVIINQDSGTLDVKL